MKRGSGKLPPFVPLYKATGNTAAWKAMSHGARSLYASLKARYNKRLQNAAYLSTRNASKELGSYSRRDNVMRWFRELEYYGFIRMVSLAHHGVNGHGRAPHYRLTEEWYLGKAPTREFLNWDGVIFHEQKGPKDYQTKNRSRGPYGVATLAHTLGPVSERRTSMNGKSGPPAVAMWQQDSGPDVGAITSLTTPSVSSLPLSLSSPSVIAARRQRLNDLSTRLAVFAPIRVMAETELDRGAHALD
jgi:hypothetical protein